MAEERPRKSAQLEKTREQLEKSERQCSQLLAAAGELEEQARRCPREEQAEQEAHTRCWRIGAARANLALQQQVSRLQAKLSQAEKSARRRRAGPPA